MHHFFIQHLLDVKNTSAKSTDEVLCQACVEENEDHDIVLCRTGHASQTIVVLRAHGSTAYTPVWSIAHSTCSALLKCAQFRVK